MTARWDPLSPTEVQTLFAEFDAPWWIAGGIAIELAVGKQIREHGDLDVLILRRDQRRLREIMKTWDIHVANPEHGGLRPWLADELLVGPVNGLWCRRRTTAPWALDILLDEAFGATWVSRRCAAVRRPISSVGWLTANRVPVIAPEIQLYYKAKNPRSIDERDFEAILPQLTVEQRKWLDDALATISIGHPWRSRIR